MVLKAKLEPLVVSGMFHNARTVLSEEPDKCLSTHPRRVQNNVGMACRILPGSLGTSFS